MLLKLWLKNNNNKGNTMAYAACPDCIQYRGEITSIQQPSCIASNGLAIHLKYEGEGILKTKLNKF